MQLPRFGCARPKRQANRYCTSVEIRKTLLARNSLGLLEPNFQVSTLYKSINYLYLTSIFDQMES